MKRFSIDADEIVRILHSAACVTQPYFEDTETDRAVICGVFDLDRAANEIAIYVNSCIDLQETQS